MALMADSNLAPVSKQDCRMLILPYEIVLLVAELLSLPRGMLFRERADISILSSRHRCIPSPSE